VILFKYSKYLDEIKGFNGFMVQGAGCRVKKIIYMNVEK